MSSLDEPPLIMGGQGRSGNQVSDSARHFERFVVGIVFAAAVFLLIAWWRA